MTTILKTSVCIMLLAASAAATASKPVTPESKMLPLYRQECSTCHMAYPPEFLSKPAWSRVMKNLGKHYGTDASLEAADIQQISQWLAQTGGTYKRVVESSKEDRLTTTPWFAKKHNDIDAATFKRAAIKSPANCAACHTKAAEGNFDEDFVRIPK